MKKIFKKIKNSLVHLEILDETFREKDNYPDKQRNYLEFYNENLREFNGMVEELKLTDKLYAKKSRQMILADLLEYIFLGRGYYSINSKENKGEFIKLLLHFANLLMCYETITSCEDLRKIFLSKLGDNISEIKKEDLFSKLQDYSGNIATNEETKAGKTLENCFDSLLPKTAGGLWHELLVYAFLLRKNFGYILPLLLNQRLLSLEGNLVPPDYLIISFSKQIYGIEVGKKKEIQSGKFSLRTNIPTATIDTINSRLSDRCPICKRWILICPYAINRYSKVNTNIDSSQIKCLEDCDLYDKEQIVESECPYTKYSRNRAETLDYSHHEYADGKHYHYSCILNEVSNSMKKRIIKAEDNTALKNHFPDYTGLEGLE